MFSNIGSNKIHTAKVRLNEERKFLDSLSIQCDESFLIDEVISDEGMAHSVPFISRAIEDHPNQIRFVLNGLVINLESIQRSLKLIANCREIIKNFEGQ